MSEEQKEQLNLLGTSFEEMTVSPTPGSPIGPDGSPIDVEPAPSSKITFNVEIRFKDQTTKKAVRILPTSTMHDFIDKLYKKKMMPSSSQLGGATLKSEQISVRFGKNKDNLSPFPFVRWAEPLWNSGFRDKV